MRAILIALTMFAFTGTAAHAQVELSFYGAAQRVSDSEVTGNDSAGTGPFGFISGWQDNGLDSQTDFGLRLTWWQNEKRGWGLDFASWNATADASTLAANGLTELEFSQGANLLTVNTYRRWNEAGSLSPYVGAGIGVSVPRVAYDAGGASTDGFQLAGPAMQWIAGASYPIGDHWSVFGEYRGSYSINSVDLSGGGSLDADILTNGINIGLSLGF